MMVLLRDASSTSPLFRKADDPLRLVLDRPGRASAKNRHPMSIAISSISSRS